MFRCYLDETGSFIPRKFRRPEDAVLVLTGIKTQMEVVEPYVSEYLREDFNVLGDRVEVQLEISKKISRSKAKPDEIEVIVPIPEKLQRFCKDHDMHSQNEVNRLVDGHISNLYSLLDGLVYGSPTKAESAKLLQKRWVLKKREPNFLFFSSPHQWLAVDERFTNLSEDEEEAVDQAGVRENLDTIQGLNSHHGNLQGITEKTILSEDKKITKEQRAEAMDSFHNLLGHLVIFANIAWPDDETSKYRISLLDPYLDRVRRKNKLATNRKKRKDKQKLEIEEKKDNQNPDGSSKNFYPKEEEGEF